MFECLPKKVQTFIFIENTMTNHLLWLLIRINKGNWNRCYQVYGYKIFAELIQDNDKNYLMVEEEEEEEGWEWTNIIAKSGLFRLYTWS